MIRRLYLLYLVVLALAWLAATGRAPCAFGQQAPTESVRAAQIKAHMREILSSPDFRVEKPGDSVLQRIGRWIERTLDRIWQFFRRLFSFGGRAGTGGSYLFLYVVLGILIVGIAYVIAYAARNLHRAARPSAGQAALSVVAEPEPAAAAEPDAWIEAAQRHAAAGDFRRAYRAVFIAVLLRLDRIGALRYERSRTNGEYLRALRSRPPLLTLVRPLASEFDAHWYGHRPASEDDFRRVLAAYEKVATINTV